MRTVVLVCGLVVVDADTDVVPLLLAGLVLTAFIVVWTWKDGTRPLQRLRYAAFAADLLTATAWLTVLGDNLQNALRLSRSEPPPRSIIEQAVGRLPIVVLVLGSVWALARLFVSWRNRAAAGST